MSDAPSQGSSQIAGLTDADFRGTILRAIRLTAILLALGVPLVWWKLGGGSAAYLLLGGVISGSSLWQGLRLMTAVMRQMDAQNQPDAQNPDQRRAPSLTPVFLGLVLHMGIALVLLYVTLKTLDGSVYALGAGFLAGVFALSVEAFRIMRPGTV
jgi:hypothetical protein